MRVLFLQRQPCVRALKYAVALRASGEDELALGFAYQGRTLTDYYGSGDELFDAWWDLGGASSPAEPLREVLDHFAPDLVHSHNLPDSLSVLAMELTGGRIPIVHDVHDLQSLRRTPYRDGFPEPADPLGLERRAVEGADALITVSPELLDVLDRTYAIPERSLVVPNSALRRDLPELPSTRAAGPTVRLVYQGSLATDGSHYDLRDIFRSIAGAGLEVHVHPNRPAPAYERLAETVPGITVNATVDPAALMSALPVYDLGWAGFNAGLNRAHLDTVLPNKLFEYLAAGLPVLTLRGHRALARFVEAHGVGIVLDRTEQVAEALARTDLAELRRTVAAARDGLTFERSIRPVIDLYRSLVGSDEPAAGRGPGSGVGRPERAVRRR